MYAQKLCLLYVLSSSLYLSCMEVESLHDFQNLPSELVPIILSATNNLDTLYAFRQTCTTYRTAYPITKILDELLPCTDLAQLVPALNDTQHARILVHYAQSHNDDMLHFIHSKENESQSKNSSKLIEFFGYNNNKKEPRLLRELLKKALLGKENQYTHLAPRNLYLRATAWNSYHAFTVLLANNIPYDNGSDIHGDTLLITIVKKHFPATRLWVWEQFVSQDYMPIMQLLLHHNFCNKDQQNLKGNTALHYACERGSIELVKVLIKAGCGLNLQNNKKETPLHVASFATAHLLINAGANIDIKDEHGKTTLDKFSAKNRRALLHSAKTRIM